MRRLGLVVAVPALALAVSSCATMNVSSYAERGVDFARYRTYDWGPADMLPTGDPRLDNNPFFHKTIKAAIEHELAARGFEKTTSWTADLLLHYHASVNQRIDVYEVDREHGYCPDYDCRPRMVEYDEGTLLLDIVEARTDTIIWRGWARDSVNGVIENQARLEKKINEAVARMMELFPRRL